MKMLKKIFALILCPMIALGAVLLTVSATDDYSNVPAMTESEDVFIIGKGAVIQGVLGSSALTGQAHLPGYNTANPAQVSFVNPGLADYSDFEFDYYVDDIAAFNARNMEVYFNVRAAALNSKGTFEFRNQITHTGWNHVKIAADLDSDILNSLTIVRFYMDMDAGSAGAGDRYRVANICATRDLYNSVPEMSQSEGVFIMDQSASIKGVLGGSALTGQGHLPGYNTANPAQVSFTNTGLDGYDYFEFDYFVDNVANFNARAIKLYFYVRAGSSSKGIFEFQDQISKSGWNHVRIPAALDPNEMNCITTAGFYMSMDAGETGATDRYRVANIYAAKDLYDVVPEGTQSKDAVEFYKGVKIEGVLGNSELTGQAHLPGYSSGSPAQVIFENPGLAGYGCFEFDYYVDDIADFNARAIKLYFNVRRTASASYGIFEFQNQITHTGWNHVKIVTNLDSDVLNNLTIVRFYMDMNEGETGAADRYRVANIYAAKDPYTIIPALTESEDMFVIGDGAQIQGVLGSSALTGQAHLPGYNTGSPAQVSFTNPGLAEYGCFEFDYYVDNIDSFHNRKIKLYFNVRVAALNSKGTFEFQNQIINSGWNHVKVAAPLDSDILNDLTIVRFYMDMDAGETGASDRYRVANICATKDPYSDVPEMVSSQDVFVIGEGAKIQGVLGSSALAGQAHLPGYSSVTPAEVIFTNPGLDGYGCFEFDYYVDDIDNFHKRAIKLYFNMRDTVVSKGTFEFQNQITHTGWNHVKIAASSQSDILNSVTKIRFYMDMDAGETGAADRYGIANICATVFRIPDLPDYVVAQIGTSKSATLGDYFHTAEDRFFEEKLDGVDFSRATAIEFDLYIDDYKALLAAEKASAENYSGLPYARESRLALYFSSTPANLWQQYKKPRKYFSARITLSDKITHDGWNHIVVGKGDFTANAQEIDWSHLTGWMVAFIYGSDAHKEVNPYPNVMINICNIVNTGVVSNIPKDREQKARPDKNAVYISDSETISDENGTWNPRSVYISNKYRSEGKASVALDLNYRSTAKDAYLYYLFDETADLRDLKTLKFDFFVDLPQFIQASGNKAEVLITNQRNETGDCYKWNLDFSKLKSGWNSFELGMNAAKKYGNPDLSQVKVIMLSFTELNIDAKAFAEIVIGMDNIRYLSSTGSTVLKVNHDHYDFDDNNAAYDAYSDDEAVNDISEETITEQEPVTVTSAPKTKYLKTLKKLTRTNYLASGIVLGIEAVILLTGVIIFMIVYRKKRRSV